VENYTGEKGGFREPDRYGGERDWREKGTTYNIDG
jgi:hypothetical protein